MKQIYFILLLLATNLGIANENNTLLAPAATISGGTTVCQNDARPLITFTGSGGTAPYTFTYKINNVTQPIIVTTSGNSVTVDVPTDVLGTFVYSLVSVKDNTNATQNQTGSTTVIVTVPPTVDFTFSNNATCSGTAVQFNSSVTGPLTYTYTWDFGDSTPTSSAQNPSHAFVALGCGTSNFTVTLTVTVGNCSVSRTKTISVKQKPDISFTDINNPAEPFSNCSGASTNPVFTVTVDPIGALPTCVTSYTVNWNTANPDIETNVTFPISHTYNQLGVYTMTITAFGTNGCSNTVTYQIKNISSPGGGLSIPNNIQNLCAPTPSIDIAITNWGTNSLDTTYSINYGDSSTPIVLTQGQLVSSSYYNAANPASSSAFPIPHSFTATSCPTYYTITLNIANACNANPPQTATIYVITKPITDFIAPAKACDGSSVLFTNTTIPGFGNNCSTGTTLYTWDFGDPVSGASNTINTGYINTIPNANHIFSGPGTYTVKLTAQNIACGISTITKEICIEPTLVPQFTINLNNGCTPLIVQATDTTNLANACPNNPTYQWNVTYASDFCGTSPAVWSYASGSETSANPLFNFVTSGIYTIRATVTNSCGSVTSSSQTVTVKKPPTVSINPINDVCGAATITPVATVDSCAPTGSTLTYDWSFPGGTPATSSAVNPGVINFPESPTPYTITLTVTNECGISNTASETFSVNTAPAITNTNLSQTICSGTATTLVNLIVNPSTATISWTATGTTGVTGFNTTGTNTIPVQTITTTSTTVGTVTYVITPSITGCNGTPVNYVITVNPAPVIVTNPTNSNICLGQTPTQLSVSYTNGSGTPVYEWFSNTTGLNSGGTSIPSSNSPTYDPPAGAVGTLYYYCVITFPALTGSCSFITSTAAEVTIVDSASIANQPLATQSLCVGATIPTPLIVTTTGGIGTPTYQWYSNTNNTTTGGTLVGTNSPSYTPPVYLSTGMNYYYVVISYTNGCGNLTSTVAQVDVVSDPTITAQPLATQTVCQTTTATPLSVVATGGIGSTYSYQWYSDNDNDSTNGVLLIGETNDTFAPPTTNAGTFYYYCVITQPTSTGCSVTSSSAMVTVNIAPAFTTTLVSSTICLGQTPSQTPNQLVIVTNSDALSPNYQWYSTPNIGTVGTALTSETNATFNPPATTAGTTYYYCVVTFPTIVGACSEIISTPAEVVINQNPVIGPETETICSTTSFSITPLETNGNIIPTGTTYTWTTPTVNPVGAVTNATAETNPQTTISQNLINITTNPATVTYTVTPKSGSCLGASFLVTVTVNPAINPNVIASNNTCFGVNNASITTNITGGIPPYTITWTSPNGFSSSATSILNIAPGTYDLLITDTGNCPFTSSYIITEPNDIVITTDSNTNITCFEADNGSIAISVSGGTGAYTYSWTKDTFPYAATDDISNLAPGSYEVTVSDANNCGPKTATFTITEPPLLEVTLASQINVDCFGFSTGAINIDVVGGTSPYTYAWSNGETAEDISSIPAGFYNLVVTDNLGCVQNISVTITQSPEIIINAITTTIECYGDNDATIDVTISGGVGPYQYQWSNLATTLNLTNLSPDDYIITVTDGIGCEKVLPINIPSPPIFDVTPVVTNISCFGANDGSIDLNFIGGIAPVTLVWNDGSTSGTSRNNLPPGIYSVVITDSKPCTISRTFTIVEPSILSLSANLSNPLDCTNGSSGDIDLIIAGGVPPYSFLWTNGATTEDLSGVTAGNYGVTLTDANGCTTSKTYTLIRPMPLEVGVTTQTDFNCATRVVNQSFVAQATGGVPPYQYQWSSGNTSGTNNEIMSTPLNGIVILTVTDDIGCTTSYSVDVDNPVIGIASFEPTSIGIINYGMFSIGDPIQFESTITGDYISVLWDFGDGTFSTEVSPIHTYLNIKDSYTVTQTVTYPFGCTYTLELQLNVEKGYVLVVPTAFTPNGDTKNDTYKPVAKALKNIQLDIYDTWGSLIYSEKGEVLMGWDGKVKGVNVENGNYYSKVSGETFYGSIVNQNQTFVLIK